MIETLPDLLNLPGIQKAMKSSLVSTNLDKFKLFLGSFLLDVLNKWTVRLKKYLKWSNLILINLLVISYYGGKANAYSVSEWFSVLGQIEIWWGYQIVVNIVFLSLRFFRDILIAALKVVLFILFVWWVYLIFLKVKSYLKEQFCRK